MPFLEYKADLSPESQWVIVSPTVAARASLLYMQEIGHFYAGPNYFTTREGYDSFLIKYTLSGCGQMEYGGKTYAVPAGSMYWLDCKKWHSYRTSPDTEQWNVIWVHLYGANVRMYYDTYLKYNGGEPVMALPEGNTIAHTLQALLALDNSGANQFEADLRAANLLNQLISECTLSAMRSNTDTAIPQIVQSIQSHLQQNYKNPNSLEELGALFNLNPFYLQKLFKRYIGQSPNEYCIHLRITHAKELLRNTYLSISEIAYQIGIENFGYFTRLFKKHEGLTPQEYRQLWPILPLQQHSISDAIPPQYQENP